MATSPASTDRPLRRDAERNRQRIMDAARVVFAERGLRASHDEIAHEAGVGVGTVYRRFPDREQLIDALFEERMTEMVAIAEAGLAIEDPWDGLVHFIVAGQELQCGDRALKEIILSSAEGRARVELARSQIAPRVERLLERARAAGVVRDDLELTDIPVIQLALGAIADYTRDVAPDTWRRVLTLVLDGLRPARSAPTPCTQPALDLEQLAAAMHTSGMTRRS